MGWAIALLAVALTVALAVTVERLYRTRDEARTLKGNLDRQKLIVDELAARTAEPDPDPQLVDGTGAGGNPSLVDDDSGLYNDEFFHVTLEARVSAARRHLRPVAVVLLEVGDSTDPSIAGPADPHLVGSCLRDTLRDADTACRRTDGSYGLILEDTPENGAVWTVERVRRALAERASGRTLWAGVACYPAHAFDAEELLARAVTALRSAKEWHQDRIEVAITEE